LYCHADGSERPLCGSVFMKEYHTFNCDKNGKIINVKSREEHHILFKKWNDWSKDREVSESGICDEYEKN